MTIVPWTTVYVPGCSGPGMSLLRPSSMAYIPASRDAPRILVLSGGGRLPGAFVFPASDGFASLLLPLPLFPLPVALPLPLVFDAAVLVAVAPALALFDCAPCPFFGGGGSGGAGGGSGSKR